MRIGLATPISLRLLQDLVSDGDHLPVGYEFAPASDWVRELLRRGHDVYVYTYAEDLSASRTFTGHHLQLRVAKHRGPGSARDFFSRERKIIVRMMREDRCDLIHAHWTCEFALAAFTSKLPTLVTIHDLPWNVLRYFRDRYRGARVLMAYGTALWGKHFTAVSSDAASHFKNYFRPFSDIAVVPNGLPWEVFGLADLSDGAGDRPPTFCTILQGWSLRKNPETALRAFQLVRLEIDDARLIMFGHDYEQGGPAQTFALREGLADGVQFAGPQPYPVLLRRTRTEIDVLVHPSLDESFSMAALEAMALGKCVIGGQDTPGIREVLDYGRAGMLVDVTRPEAVARAMIALGSDLTLRSRLAELAKTRASQFHIERVFDLYEAQYRKILKLKE